MQTRPRKVISAAGALYVPHSKDRAHEHLLNALEWLTVRLLRNPGSARSRQRVATCYWRVPRKSRLAMVK
jgi:hypothetical protein